MLPALSFTDIDGGVPTIIDTGLPAELAEFECAQLWWHTSDFYGVCYLHRNGTISGSHIQGRHDGVVFPIAMRGWGSRVGS